MATPTTTTKAMEELSRLLHDHQSHLVRIYTTLGHPSPSSHVAEHISQLHASLVSTIRLQAQRAEEEVEACEKEGIEVEKRVRETRTALGCQADQVERGLGRIPDETLLARLERLKGLEGSLEALRKERQALVDGLWERIERTVKTLGQAMVDEQVGEAGDRHKVDLTAERVQKLERAATVLETETVRLFFLHGETNF